MRQAIAFSGGTKSLASAEETGALRCPLFGFTKLITREVKPLSDIKGRQKNWRSSKNVKKKQQKTMTVTTCYYTNKLCSFFFSAKHVIGTPFEQEVSEECVVQSRGEQ